MTAPDRPAPAPVERTDVPCDSWVEELLRRRDEGFAVFDWLGAIDETDRAHSPGVDVICSLISPPAPGAGMRRAVVTTTVPPEGALPSLTGLWRGAAWYEREAHEMTGLAVSGFDDGTGLGLRRLLLPPQLAHPPLRDNAVLAPRVAKPWPGLADDGSGTRRRSLPPGVSPDRSDARP